MIFVPVFTPEDESDLPNQRIEKHMTGAYNDESVTGGHDCGRK
jgi:hypothetical protein